MPRDGEDAIAWMRDPRGQASLIGPLQFHGIEWA